ncbi:hypothetical protein E2C01_088144 [Portunus trituberculatus]|uniref:Uncharacterized protein n=1 Tax=Portunus trituberculatus TaxID=210409 RepID=A0A5B7JDP8_PORTR|nr:hypothetical protein [Portunus trituberculatus]
MDVRDNIVEMLIRGDDLVFGVSGGKQRTTDRSHTPHPALLMLKLPPLVPLSPSLPSSFAPLHGASSAEVKTG